MSEENFECSCDFKTSSGDEMEDYMEVGCEF